jgi:hypothetical protein
MVLNIFYFTGKLEVAMEDGIAFTMFTQKMWYDYFLS